MSLKGIIPVFPVMTSQQMIAASTASPLASAVTDVTYKDNIAYEATFTGTPTGTFYVQGSLSYKPAQAQAEGYGAPNAGVWTNLPNSLWSSVPVASGAAGTVLLNITQRAFPYIRLTYVSTALAAQTVALVADVSGSLNSKYFLLEDASGAHKYYVWFNINSAGVDPAVAGRTGVPITGATNASAATLGAAVATAVAALNGAASFSTSGTSTVTITDLVAGPLVIASDGTAATGFTFTATTGSGLLSALVSGKAI